MAVTPRRLGLTRDQFASFLQDFEQIKQFENLFATVDTINNVTLDDINISAGNANATANEANDSIQRLLDALDRQPSDQSPELLAAINELRQELQTMPRNELGTMAPLQQSDIPWLTFNNAPTPVPTAVGSVYWDGGTTLNVQATSGVLMRVGEAEYTYIKASAAITKGQLCYHTGSVGSAGVINAAPTPLALADPNQIVGIAAENIALNGFGLIQVSGVLRGFNTTGSNVGETWADGDALYYNPAYVGRMTKVKPSAPNQKTYIGEVVDASPGAAGSVIIRLSPGSTLGGTDSNVQFGALANNDLIQYDSTAQYWKNVPASSIAIGTATALSGGAANRIAYQTAPNTTGFIVAPTSANTYLEWSGSAFQWSANPLGTVTSVSGTGTVNGITLTGTVTSSGSLTLGGTLSGISLTTQVSGTLPVANGGTGVTTSTGSGSVVLSASPTFTGTLNAATISATKILPNVQSVASASTITPNADTDTQVSVTALAVPATIAAPSGTPSDGQSLVIRIEDNGTPRALTWTTGSSGAYRAVGITLPTTTVAAKVLYVGCKYNSTDLRWDAIALSQEA